MKSLHYLISRFATWIVPVILVIFSLSINLTNASLHKNTLKNSDFYNKLSNQLQTSELKTEDIQKGFSSIIISSVIKDLASPGWLQNLFEKNIDGTSKWLSGETDDLGVYVPSKEIETSVSKSLDSKVNEVKEKFGGDITTCNTEQSQSIKRQGFSLSNQFCLPQEVKSGNQSLTEFIGLSDKDTQNSEFLDKLITGNNLNPFSDTINAKELPSTNPIKSTFFDGLNRVRGGFIFLTGIRFYLIGLVAVLFALSLILARFADRNVLKDAKRFLWRSATGTIVLVALIILTLGGSIYLTSFAQNLLLPGIATDQLVNLITFEVIKFIFNVFSLAVFIAIGFFALFGGIILLEKVGILNKFSKTNKKIQESSKPEIKSNPTFDGQFQNVLLDKIEAQPKPTQLIDNQEIAGELNPDNFGTYTNPQTPDTTSQILGEEPNFVTPNQATPSLNNPTSLEGNSPNPVSTPTQTTVVNPTTPSNSTVVNNNPNTNTAPRPKIQGL